MSLGSVAGTETHPLIGERLGYTGSSELGDLQSEVDEIGRMLRALRFSIDNRQR